MALIIKVLIRMGVRMVKDFLNGPMKVHMKEISKINILRDLEFTNR